MQGSFSTARCAAVFAKGGKVGHLYWPKDTHTELPLKKVKSKMDTTV